MEDSISFLDNDDYSAIEQFDSPNSHESTEVQIVSENNVPENSQNKRTSREKLDLTEPADAYLRYFKYNKVVFFVIYCRKINHLLKIG